MRKSMRARLSPGRSAKPLAACALTLLAGCAGLAPSGLPSAPAAEGYTAAWEDASALPSDAGIPPQRIALGEPVPAQWWQLFGSPALDRLVERAIAGNRSIASARSTLQAAEALVAARAGQLDPQLTASGTVGRQKYGKALFGPLQGPPPFTYYALGPAVSYTVDYKGALSEAVEQQSALAEVRRQELAAAYLSITGNVVLQALTIASDRAQLAAVDDLISEDRENLKLVQTAFDAGVATRVDILSAQSQLSNDETRLPPLRQDVSIAEHALAVLLGEPPAALAAGDVELAGLALPRDLPVSVPSELAHRRPDILAAEAQVRAASAALGVAAANLYPRITLSASGGLQALDPGHLFNPSSTVFSLAAGLTAPLFDGGTLRAERRSAAAALQASAASYEEAVLEGFGQVADALQALQHDAEALGAQSRAVDAARSSLALTRESYRVGNVGVLQVLDAQRLYEQARLGAVRAEAQRYVDTARLYLALGGNGAAPIPAS